MPNTKTTAELNETITYRARQAAEHREAGNESRALWWERGVERARKALTAITEA